VRLIKRAMSVEVSLIVGWVNSGGPKGYEHAPAWVSTPREMPYYGTAAFKEMKIKMFLRKSFLEKSTYDQIAIAISHELSHVVLDSIRHPLRSEEKAVDLTAMMLGFCNIYELAAYKEKQWGGFTEISHLGYLSRGELQTASQILIPTRVRLISTLREMAKNSAGLAVLVGLLYYGLGRDHVLYQIAIASETTGRTGGT
jgi:hypothetical protein